MTTRTLAIVAAVLFLTTIAQGRDASGQEWWTPPGDVKRWELKTLAELKLAYATLAWETFIKIFNSLARDIRLHDTVRAEPIFADTLFDLRWSSNFINSHRNRSLLLSALRDVGILLLDGHCSFVNLAHFELNSDLLAEKVGLALANWKRSLVEL